MGAEDFSYVLEKIPGCYLFIGCCPDDLDPEQAANVHDPNVLFNEEVIEHGIRVFSKIVFDYLGN